MPDKSPSLHRKPQVPWDQILLGIIQIQGGDILSRILEQKVRSSQGPRQFVSPLEIANGLRTRMGAWRRAPRLLTLQTLQSLREQARHAPSRLRSSALHALDQTRHNVGVLQKELEQLRHGPDRTEPLRKAALKVACGTGYSVGFVVGTQLPPLDLRLSTKGKEADAVVLHSAALIASEVGLQWVREILERTLSNPTLAHDQVTLVRAALKVVAACGEGLERGWSAQRVTRLWLRFWAHPKTQVHRIATDGQAVRTVTAAIERLRGR